ncbi:conserved hypothetical protein [Neospora caninum Liverpool]|uniref:Uncharacterized protein n=1 Tax=Neospora caninum (strain Liverpool) TaxID=572307 RepID=F0VP07_NEOCL|nr:conserved hypothetical protein [Neospora caninum Liverpool]CBZ55453.1 conserved hypothetical protein [Neospora caninum Liverpool]CEL70188.1 TPA: hypothetical protein BN1204_058760 [Neospora caninum Liverpool]|eukprot:XP_003885481.1 conserved hypothetical protein [Neospora caninum Liverpool]
MKWLSARRSVFPQMGCVALVLLAATETLSFAMDWVSAAENVPSTDAPREGVQVGAAPRRLLSEGLSMLVMQYLLFPEMRESLVDLGNKSMEILKGGATYDVLLEYYHDLQNCVVVFDTLYDGTHFGLVNLDKITITYSHVQHQGVIDYEESRRDAVEILKQKQRHLQKFNLPRGCIADDNSYWVGYCRSESPPCYVGRVEVHFAKGEANEQPIPLEPVPYETFLTQLVDREGMGFYDVEDIVEAETPLFRLTWDPERCFVHYRYLSDDPSATKYYWIRIRQAFRIDVKNPEDKFVRKMSAMGSDCGGEGPADFSVTHKRLDDGSYKAIFRARRLMDYEPRHSDTIELKKANPLLPVQDWDPDMAEAVDFIDLFPDSGAAAFDMLVKEH